MSSYLHLQTVLTKGTETAESKEKSESEEAMDTSAAEVSIEDSSDRAKNDQEEAVSMDTSELDSKENSLSVSLFVHTDDIQDDLDDDLKEAAAAAAAKEKEMKEEKAAEGKQKSFFNAYGYYAASEGEGNHDNRVSGNHQARHTGNPSGKFSDTYQEPPSGREGLGAKMV